MDNRGFEFQTEAQKLDYIDETKLPARYKCPECQELFSDAQQALECCTIDCYDQYKVTMAEKLGDIQQQEAKH